MKLLQDKVVLIPAQPAAVERFGKLDTVVCNAGVFAMARSWESSEAQWRPPWSTRCGTAARAVFHPPVRMTSNDRR